MSVVGPILRLNKSAQCRAGTFPSWDKADVTAAHILEWASGILALILIPLSWLGCIGPSVGKKQHICLQSKVGNNENKHIFASKFLF